MGKSTTTIRAPNRSGGKATRKAQSPPLGIVKKIHPNMLADSPWNTRHESAYYSNAYIALKKDLEAHKGNQIPVLVRPNPEYNHWSKANGTPKWQLVYGGMRHAACRALDIKMHVFVQDLTDAQAYAKAHAENALRSQISVFERGLFYCSALESGLFSSMRVLAAHLKVSVSEVSRATFLAKLPDEVLQTMTSPADILILDADKLRPAWEKDPFEVMMRADEINEKDGPLTAKEAILRLTRPEQESVAACNTSTSIPLQLGERVFGKLNISAAGHTSISFNKPLSKFLVDEVQLAIIQFAKDHIEDL